MSGFSGPALGREDLIASYFTLTGSPVMVPPRFSFRDRVAAAAEAGFSAIGLLTDDYLACREAGLDDRTMRSILDDHGIGIGEVEFLFLWTDDREEMAAGAAAQEDLAWAMAEAFEPRHVNVGELRPPGEALPMDRLAERFSALAGRAASHGLLVAFEFLPWTAVPDVETAIELVRLADCPNAGLLVDAAHLFWGNSDLGSLRDLKPHEVTGVQMDDGDLAAGGDPAERTMTVRTFPGSGDFDLLGLIRALDEIGVDAPLSAEILCPEIQAMPVREAARRTHDTLRAVVDKARSGAPESRRPSGSGERQEAG